MTTSNGSDSPGEHLDELLHDMKQPLNLIVVTAQDLRIDKRKQRLDIESLPEKMREIESAAKLLAEQLNLVRDFVRLNFVP